MQLQVEIEQTFGKLSEEQFMHFCLANRDLRIERDENGQIFIMSPTYLNTGRYNLELATEFALWNRQYKLGHVFDSSSGITLPDKSVKSPDVCWISNEKWAAITEEEKKSFTKVVPDFVLELRSETDTLSELKSKMKKYKKNGVPLGWLIDPKRQKTYIYRQNQEVEEVSFETDLSGENILAGFSINLKSFFEKLG
jgi:Uma2 family endonuclease